MQNLRADAWPSCCQFICDGFPRPREQFIDPVDRVIGGPRDVSRKEASESSPLSLAISMSVYILALGFRRYPNRQRNNFFDLTQSRGHSANIGQEVVVRQISNIGGIRCTTEGASYSERAARIGRVGAPTLPRCRSCCGGRPTAHRRSGRLLIVRDHARRRPRRKLATGRTITSPISSDPGWYEPMPAGFRGLLGPGLHGATRRKMAAITGREHGGTGWLRLIVLPPMLQRREHIMTPADMEGRRVIALRLFDALCAQYPDKYIYLIQPCDLAEDATAADPPANSGAARSDPTEGGQSRLILN